VRRTSRGGSGTGHGGIAQAELFKKLNYCCLLCIEKARAKDKIILNISIFSIILSILNIVSRTTDWSK
jgi:hypothetical protein